MKVYRNISEIKFDKQSVITVGTFDGVHLGHGKIIDKLNEVRLEKNLRSVIVTFEPHPQIVLRNRSKDIKILTTLEEKTELLGKFGIDELLVLEFTKEFSNTSAGEFFEEYLVNKIGLCDLILGYDHMFGKNREGNLDTLNLLSKRFDFEVDRVDEFRLNGERVNSTAIRHLLESGDTGKAAKMLGRNYGIEGTVIEGKRLGRKIGFPTANIKVNSEFKLIPKSGIYAVEFIHDGKKYFGMMSIGKNPTVSSDGETRLEVNVFDFDKEIYGENARVNFVTFLREEKKFDSVEILKENISLDKEKTLSIINQTEN